MYDILEEEELKLEKNIEIAEKLKKARHIEGLAFRATIDGQIVESLPSEISSISGSKNLIVLKANTKNVKTLIGTYITQMGCQFIFDADDPYQDVLFIPHTSNNEFIIGDLEIILEKADGNEKPKTIIDINTNIMKPTSMSHLRRWENSYIAIKGDKIKVYFTGDKVLCPEKSDIEIRLRENIIIL